jgi:DDE superfamily endonuclease
MTFADKGYQGARRSVRTPFKRRRFRPELSRRQMALNRTHAKIRARGERAIATLKTARPDLLRLRDAVLSTAIALVSAVDGSRNAWEGRHTSRRPTMVAAALTAVTASAGPRTSLRPSTATPMAEAHRQPADAQMWIGADAGHDRSWRSCRCSRRCDAFGPGPAPTSTIAASRLPSSRPVGAGARSVPRVDAKRGRLC